MSKKTSSAVSHYHDIDPEWIIDNGDNHLFNRPANIKTRAEQAPTEERELVEEALRYIYLSNGRPTSPVPTGKYQDARLAILERHLTKGEMHVFRNLRNRTLPYNSSIPETGYLEDITPRQLKNLRNRLGEKALRRMQAARFRCETCGMPHVRTLTLDHVQGIRHDRGDLMVLCANCHIIKSHQQDFTTPALLSSTDEDSLAAALL